MAIMKDRNLVSIVWQVVPMGERQENGVIRIDPQKYRDVKNRVSGSRSFTDEHGRRRDHRCYPRCFIYLKEEPKRIMMRCGCETYLRNWADELELPTYNRG